MKLSGISRRSPWLAPVLALLAGCAGGPQVPVRTAPAPTPLSLTMLHGRAGQQGIAVTGMARSRSGTLREYQGYIRLAALRADGEIVSARCVRWGPVHHRTRSWAPFAAHLRAPDPAAIREITADYVEPASC